MNVFIFSGTLIYFVLVVYGFWLEVNGAKVHPSIRVDTDDN